MSIKQKRRIKFGTFVLAPALLIAVLAVISAISFSGSSAVAEYTVPAEYQTCTECHDDTSLVTGKVTQWETSLHGTGEAYLRGTSASCAGCHSGGGFSHMVANSMQPNTVDMDPVTAGNQGDPNPTRQGCRACHQVHNSYTGVDWALETTSPVDFYVANLEGVFDGGNGNLCASCHQPRTKAPSVAAGGTVTGISSHWGPHHGPESTMMLGTNGAGSAAVGSPSAHYTAVGGTCATCHMGSGDNHSFAPAKATCQGCHAATQWAAGASNFDVNGVQTQVQGKLDTLKTLLINAGTISCVVDEEGVEECHTVIPAGSSSISLPDNQAYALWNFESVGAEDGSKGVHNPDYANALLDASIAGISCDEPVALSIALNGNPFWASYADYTARLLTVSYTLSNSGSANAFNVNVSNSIATTGVTLATPVPASVGNIGAGSSAQVSLQYNVPTGVGSFRTTNSATAEDNCGTTFMYGAQPPTA